VLTIKNGQGLCDNVCSDKRIPKNILDHHIKVRGEKEEKGGVIPY